MSYPPQPPQAPQAPQQPAQYPPQYQQGQYQQPYGQYQAAPKTNTLALVGFWMSIALIILVWFTSWIGWIANLTAFILCIIGNSQIKASNGTQTGKGLAVAGIVITSILFGLIVLFTIVLVGMIGSILGGVGGFGM